MYSTYQRFCIEWHLANLVFNSQALQAHQTAKGFEHPLTLPTIPTGLGDIFQKLWVITALKTASYEMVPPLTGIPAGCQTGQGDRSMSNPSEQLQAKLCAVICGSTVVYCCIMKNPYQHRRRSHFKFWVLLTLDCGDLEPR